MEKKLLSVIAIMLLLGGCGPKKATKKKTSTQEVSQIDLPFNDFLEESNKSQYFDDVQEFVLQEESTLDQATTLAQNNSALQDAQFTWDETSHKSEFKTMLFDYDSSAVKDSKVLAENIAAAKRAVSEGKIISCKGRACPKGKASNIYKLALSNNRAEKIAQELEKAGIEKQFIKAFGIGIEESIADINDEAACAQERCVEMYTLTI